MTRQMPHTREVQNRLTQRPRLENGDTTRHFGIAAPFGEQHEGHTLIAGAVGPLERHALAGPFLQRGVIGRTASVSFPVPLSRSPSALGRKDPRPPFAKVEQDDARPTRVLN